MSTILIVEDNPVVAKSIKRGLCVMGYEAVSAHSADEALQMLSRPDAGIDMVITDFAMPRKSGIDLLQEIRRHDKHLPVILMSAYPSKDIVAKALRLRCDGYMDKPFSLYELTEEIERVRAELV